MENLIFWALMILFGLIIAWAITETAELIDELINGPAIGGPSYKEEYREWLILTEQKDSLENRQYFDRVVWNK